MHMKGGVRVGDSTVTYGPPDHIQPNRNGSHSTKEGCGGQHHALRACPQPLDPK